MGVLEVVVAAGGVVEKEPGPLERPDDFSGPEGREAGAVMPPR